MRRSLFRALAALFIPSGLTWTAHASPPVKVQLRSSWPAPNLFLEVLESASIERSDSFFPVLDLLTSPKLFTKPLAALTGEAIHDASIETLLEYGYLSGPGELDTFEVSLALHAASPKLEAFYQYYRDHELALTQLVEGELPDDCSGSWVDWYGSRVCRVDTLQHLVETMTLEGSSILLPSVSQNHSKLLSFDHVYPPASTLLRTPSRIAILYGNVTSPNFRDLHNYLYSLARETPPRLRYVFRHVPPAGVRPIPNHLSGYGVTLDLKKMDYLALDDRKHSRGHTTTTEDSRMSENEEIENDPILDVLGESDDDVDLTTPLGEEEISGIAVKAAQLVMKSPNPLKTLTHLSQNFPKYATSVARRVEVESGLLEELERNSQKASPGGSMVWLNGQAVQESDINLLGLVRLLRKEREIIRQLTAGGLSASQAVDLLTHSAVMASQNVNRVTDGMFDSSDRQEDGGVIIWWNDIEKDSRYSQWSPSLQTMMRPLFPGSFHNVKRNLYNTVLLVDMSQSSSLKWVTALSTLIQRGFPFRFGLVPLVESEDGQKSARLLYYLIEKYGRRKTISFFGKFLESDKPTIDFNLARVEFDALVAQEDAVSNEERETRLDFNTVIGLPDSSPSQELETSLEKAGVYAKRLGADVKSPGGHAFVNGKHLDISEDFFKYLQVEISQQTQYLQEQIYVGNIDEDVDASTYFYDLPSTSKRRNKHIYPTSQTGSLRFVNLVEVFAGSGMDMATSDFVYPAASDTQILISLYVIADFDEPPGRALLRDSLASLIEDTRFRVAFVHNPSNRTSTTTPTSDRLSYRLSLLRSALVLNQSSPADLLAVVNGRDSEQVPSTEHLSLRALISSGNQLSHKEKYLGFCNSDRLLARELGLAPGQNALLINGRLIAPIEEHEFGIGDFELLIDYEYSKRVGPVKQAYTEIMRDVGNATREEFARNIAILSSVVSASQIPDPSADGVFNMPRRPRNRGYLFLDEKYSSFGFGDNTTAAYQIAFLVDPVSDQASRWTPLIYWLSRIKSVYLQVFLNPTSSLTELPLKQFYRYNLQSRLTFDESGSEIISKIEFRDLPPDPIYTLGMDVPPSWLVRPHESHHDLDNIRLSSFVGADRVVGVEAVFDLDYLVVEGHARDSMTNAPPRGLQLQLTTSNLTPIADTQVVANLGYLQFKVKPGVFEFGIREGYGREIFELDSVGNEGWDSPPVTTAGADITLTSLEGLTLYPRVHKRPGMDAVDVLAEPDPEAKSGLVDQVVSSISSLIWKQDVVVPKQQADINIFTVASGLLYERFVSIMILSVLRNTKSTVKFWFIENFLSPSFLEFIPHLAQAYNFQYELVTYKWPTWLRAQKEKQRVIWGYKILFLDVLFPMDLKKVIFVDADQIVRADLQELVDLDLHGAPYGYTPMGDDNQEMEGFRFWKTGYWKDFLGNKPYHISALYVIDLVRFRQLAAGDRLRGSYQALSADPNSLANLDQDLPNNLQHEVPIFSLPEDWLWCETWCSKDRLHRAKTIDLCQNPLTKEPKLSRARQIPEWEEYDTEISNFARKLADQGIIRSAAYASGVDELANLGSTESRGDSGKGKYEGSDAGEEPVVDSGDEGEATQASQERKVDEGLRRDEL